VLWDSLKILLKKHLLGLTSIVSAHISFMNMMVDAIGHCWTIREETRSAYLGGKHTVSVVGTLIHFLIVKSFVGIAI